MSWGWKCGLGCRGICACVHVYMYIYARRYVYMCVRKPEADAGCLPQLFYASFEAGCLIESEAYWSGWADWPENSKDPPVSVLQIPPHTAFKRVLRIPTLLAQRALFQLELSPALAPDGLDF